MCGEVPHASGLKVELQRISEGFRKKQNLFAILRPVGPFAKPRHLGDIRRHVVTWASFGISSRGRSSCHPGSKDKKQFELEHILEFFLADSDSTAGYPPVVTAQDSVKG